VFYRIVVFAQVEKQRTELQNELNDLSQRLDEAGGATQAQVNFEHLLSNDLKINNHKNYIL